MQQDHTSQVQAEASNSAVSNLPTEYPRQRMDMVARQESHGNMCYLAVVDIQHAYFVLEETVPVGRSKLARKLCCLRLCKNFDQLCCS